MIAEMFMLGQLSEKIGYFKVCLLILINVLRYLYSWRAKEMKGLQVAAFTELTFFSERGTAKPSPFLSVRQISLSSFSSSCSSLIPRPISWSLKVMCLTGRVQVACLRLGSQGKLRVLNFYTRDLELVRQETANAETKGRRAAGQMATWS